VQRLPGGHRQGTRRPRRERNRLWYRCGAGQARTLKLTLTLTLTLTQTLTLTPTPTPTPTVTQTRTRHAQWASSNHPAEDLWHLLTDCFPAPGVVGLASLQGLCESPGVVTRFEATELDPDPGGTLTLGERLAVCYASGHAGIVDGTGLCASAAGDLATPCGPGSHVTILSLTYSVKLTYDLLCLHSLWPVATADHVLCSANAGVTSNSANLWHTFAHEVAHELTLPLTLNLQ
jgi:hypothetical protein